MRASERICRILELQRIVSPLAFAEKSQAEGKSCPVREACLLQGAAISGMATDLKTNKNARLGRLSEPFPKLLNSEYFDSA